MIEYSCKYWIGDEDCHRCELRGLFYGGCDYCEDYDSGTKIHRAGSEAGKIADDCFNKLMNGGV